eukprot:9467673-Pyramimonas_sp.AAC.1
MTGSGGMILRLARRCATKTRWLGVVLNRAWSSTPPPRTRWWCSCRRVPPHTWGGRCAWARGAPCCRRWIASPPSCACAPPSGVDHLCEESANRGWKPSSQTEKQRTKNPKKRNKNLAVVPSFLPKHDDRRSATSLNLARLGRGPRRVPHLVPPEWGVD